VIVGALNPGILNLRLPRYVTQWLSGINSFSFPGVCLSGFFQTSAVSGGFQNLKLMKKK
jgi:hypothetical protein